MTDIEDPFESPKLLLARAKENIGELHKRVGAFFDRKPYARVTDKDPQTGWDRHKLRLTAKLPGSISAIYSESLSHLRHSLDQATCAASIALGATRIKQTYFPVCEDANQLDGQVSRVCRDVPDELKPFLKSLKPYRRQDSFLWAISRLASTNKHQLLTPMLIEHNGVMGVRSSVGFGVEWMPDGRWDSEKNELSVALVKPGTKPRYDLQFRLDVSLSKNDAHIRGPALPLLGMFFAETENTLSAIETETARILKERAA